MDKFTTLSGPAAPLAMVNVDTDMIIPKQFLKTIKRTGLGVHLFEEMRRTPDGKEIPGFVLNRDPWRDAKILIAGRNFGCGSSREHAPWALRDFGIRCIIAPSFADIFFNNCFLNGMLPIILPEEEIEKLMKDAERPDSWFTVDLPNQRIVRSNIAVPFTVDPFRKDCLINGLDEIGQTLQQAAAIGTFEAGQKQTQPWLYRA